MAEELFPSLNDVQTRSYRDFSIACREVEQEIYPGDPSPDMKTVQISPECMETIGFLVTMNYMLQSQGIESFVLRAAPKLYKKISEIEARTGYLLWFGRLVLDGLVNKLPEDMIERELDPKEFHEPVFSTVSFIPPEPVEE